MTEATAPNVEELSNRIAAGGRVALVERLRVAYRDAADAHADIVSLEEERIEELVQNAADHADGLQWRRALAGLVAQELGISIAEALSHPAVVRAQSIIGAPSYEQSLAELITRPIPPPLPAPAPRTHDQREADVPIAPLAGQLALEDQRGHKPEDVLSEELEPALAGDTIVELLPAPDPALEIDAEPEVEPEPDPSLKLEPESEPDQPLDQPTEIDELEAEAEDAPHEADAAAGASDTDPGGETVTEPEDTSGGEVSQDSEDEAELRVPAVHLGGVANLPTGGEGLDLRLSAQGLDIMRSGDAIIGRLPWTEIEALEVPAQRRRRRSTHEVARLVVRTRQGDASFEIPGYSSDELRQRVELRMDRYREPS